MNQIKIFKLLLLVGLLATAHINSSAQVCGYGVGNLITGTTSHGAGKFYTDATRAKVDNIAFNGSYTAATVKVYTSNIYQYGTFSVGDEVLLIQMEGSSGHAEGVHMNGIITAITTPSGEINYFLTPSNVGGCTAFPSSLTHNLGTGGNEVLQIIKVNNYEDFTLNGGVVTCHDWDGHTGGVLSMVVTDDLTINGGYFDVSGKGHFDAGITWGTGGAGGSGSSTSNTSGTSGNSGATLCVNGSYNPTPTSVTYSGAAGGTVTSGNNGSAGSNTSGSTKARTTMSYYSNASMGQPGSYNSTTGGGTGAQGGAAGGDGADNTAGGACNASGQTGGVGANGGNGGNSGESGHGAGVIIIKVGDDVIRAGGLSSTILFWANGNNGENGGQGGTGGIGGIGGDGAAACCSSGVSIICGNGGSGEGGYGGEGGDGGNGGKAGCIWVACQGTNGLSSSNVQAKGGTGGAGGPGGWGYSGLPSSPVVYMHDPCDPAVPIVPCASGSSPCVGNGSNPPTSYCTVEICDPDKVFCLLAQNADDAEEGGSDNILFKASGVTIGEFKKYSGTTGFSVVWAYEDDNINFIRYKYFALLVTQDICYDIFKGFASSGSGSNWGFPAPNTGTAIDFSVTSSNCPLTFGAQADIMFKDDVTNADALHYKDKRITDLLTPGRPACYVVACPANGMYSSGTDVSVETSGSGSSGSNGSSGADETTDADHVTLEGGASWKMLPTDVKEKITKAKLIRTYPNPATKSFTVEFLGLKVNSTCTVQLFDITGKLAFEKTFNAEAGSKHQFDVQSLARGIYMLKVITPGWDTFTNKLTLQ